MGNLIWRYANLHFSYKIASKSGLLIACAAWVGTFCTTRPLSNLRKITLTEQIFPFSLIVFTICAEKVCYKVCNTCYKLSNTCYKLCNTCYKVCNKNFLKERKKYQAERKKYQAASWNFQGLRQARLRAGIKNLRNRRAAAQIKGEDVSYWNDLL